MEELEYVCPPILKPLKLICDQIYLRHSYQCAVGESIEVGHSNVSFNFVTAVVQVLGPGNHKISVLVLLDEVLCSALAFNTILKILIKSIHQVIHKHHPSVGKKGRGGQRDKCTVKPILGISENVNG